VVSWLLGDLIFYVKRDIEVVSDLSWLSSLLRSLGANYL